MITTPNSRPVAVDLPKGEFLAFGVSPFFDRLAWLWTDGVLNLSVFGNADAALCRVRLFENPLPTKHLVDAQVIPYLAAPDDSEPDSLGFLRWKESYLFAASSCLRTEYCSVADKDSPVAALSTSGNGLLIRTYGYFSYDPKYPRQGNTIQFPKILAHHFENVDKCRVSYLRQDGTVVVALVTKRRLLKVLVWDTKTNQSRFSVSHNLDSPIRSLSLHPLGTSGDVLCDNLERRVFEILPDGIRVRIPNASGLALEHSQIRRLWVVRPWIHPGGEDMFGNCWEVVQGVLHTTFQGRVYQE